MKQWVLEIYRRKVWLFASLYLGLAWVLLQVAIAVETTLSLPDWLDQVTLVLLALGFPAVLVLAWAQDSRAGGPELETKRPERRHGRKPGLAVLPLDDYTEGVLPPGTADGLAEDLTTMLGRNGALRVAARNSAFQFRGTSIDVSEACAKLDADFAVEGSIRFAGEKARINVQLIEGASGAHIWAETFDLEKEDLEASLDELTIRIAMRVTAEVSRSWAKTARGRGKKADADAEMAACRSILTYKGYSAETLRETEERARRVIALDPDRPEAHALLALTLAFGHMIGLCPADDAQQEEVRTEARKAMEQAPDSSEVLGFVGCAYCDLDDHERGVPLIEKAIDLDKTNAQAFAALGASKLSAMDWDGGIAAMERALALIPETSGNAVWQSSLAAAYLQSGRLEEGLALARKASLGDPNFLVSRAVEIAALALMNRMENAQKIADSLSDSGLRLNQATVERMLGAKGTRQLVDAGLITLS